MSNHLDEARRAILDGDTAVGIELGSTRIKAMLVGPDHAPLAGGGYDWENKLVDGVWTYDLEEVWTGLAACYRSLADEVRRRYGVTLAATGALGVSAMMHGYLALDADGDPLVPFRTWRNTMTGPAARELSEAFRFNVPQRWTVAHLRQALLDREAHTRALARVTTLAGLVHWRLTGVFALGIGDASGLFPVDGAAGDYDARMLAAFDALPGGLGRPLAPLLPRVLRAGDNAGSLTPAGAKLLDPAGGLAAGIPLCPPEGDAGTGMVATNAVSPRTGNVSAGTSIFAMLVLEKELSRPHPEIDLVTTPAGAPVAMVHCNNGTSDLDAWVGLFREAAAALGARPDNDALYAALYRAALDGDADAGGLLAYNYLSGEHNTGFAEGRPLFTRRPESRLTLANFMRAHLYAALASLRLGMDILTGREGVRVERLLGHGGFFKAAGVGQRLMASALGAPVSVMATAGEGGAWGIALLAMYGARKAAGETLEGYLERRVFASAPGETAAPSPGDARGFAAFLERYRAGMPIERAAVDCLGARPALP